MMSESRDTAPGEVMHHTSLATILVYIELRMSNTSNFNIF